MVRWQHTCDLVAFACQYRLAPRLEKFLCSVAEVQHALVDARPKLLVQLAEQDWRLQQLVVKLRPTTREEHLVYRPKPHIGAARQPV